MSGVRGRHPSSTEVENVWHCACTYPICPYGMDKDSFTSLFINCRYISVVFVALLLCVF